MKSHTDVMFGTAASVTTFLVGHFDQIIGAAVGLVSLAVMLIRLRREWKHRNDDTPSKDE